MTIECSEADIKRFMKHVDKLPCGCWFWLGATSKGKGNKKPYGTFWVNRKVGRVRAHRFSLCINPDCIEYVTKAVNQERKRNGHHRFKEIENHAN